MAQARQGFWFGVGGGFGSAGISCDDECEDTDREGSGVAYLKGGWTLNETLLGVEFNLWSKDDKSDPDFSATINLYNVSGTVTYYPQPASGFFVKGQLGTMILTT